ncbi:unnamed protein product [Caenorhabditis bovis]|uniref:Smr domain-containing protein n=1 Tax=Caenorhabditis bovis TaxID=2654633 RepID=A0A8S1EMM5_9PELO|nr:unnamed protein product [Caenorhabditis bovis]
MFIKDVLPCCNFLTPIFIFSIIGFGFKYAAENIEKEIIKENSKSPKTKKITRKRDGKQIAEKNSKKSRKFSVPNTFGVNSNHSSPLPQFCRPIDAITPQSDKTKSESPIRNKRQNGKKLSAKNVQKEKEHQIGTFEQDEVDPCLDGFITVKKKEFPKGRTQSRKEIKMKIEDAKVLAIELHKKCDEKLAKLLDPWTPFESITYTRQDICLERQRIDDVIRNAIQNEGELDLHYMSAKGATDYFIKVMSGMKKGIYLSVITGSRNGRGQIMMHLQNYLTSNKIHYKFELLNQGQLKVSKR